MPRPHIRNPGQVRITINGTGTTVSTGPAQLLTRFINGEVHGEVPPSHARALINRGWVIRTQGRYRLTPTGHEARTAVTAYYARKQAELGGQT